MYMGVDFIFWMDLQNVLFEAYMYIFSWIPSIFPGAMKLIVRYSDGFPAYNRVDKSCNVLNIPHYIVNHHELEVVLDVRHCAAAITELKYLLPLTFLFEVCKSQLTSMIFAYFLHLNKAGLQLNRHLGNSMSNQQAKCICVSDFHETWWTCT